MDNFLVLHDQAIQGWVCESIMDDNNLVPLVDIIEDEGNKFMPVEEKYRDSNHRYESQGRIHTNIYPHTPLFESIMDMVGFALPKGGDFEMINYMQIIQYKEGTHFPFIGRGTHDHLPACVNGGLYGSVVLRVVLMKVRFVLYYN